MSTDEYTPDVSTERVRGAATGQQNVPVQPEQFDRWLAARDAEVAERIAQAIEALPDVSIPGHFATRPGGYVTRTLAARIAREGA